MKKCCTYLNLLVCTALLLAANTANAATSAVDYFKLQIKVNSNYTLDYSTNNAKLTKSVLGNNLIDIHVQPNQVPGAASISGWSLKLKGPGSNNLVQGTYASAVDSSIISSLPGLSLIKDSEDCFPITTANVGNFEIKRISRGTRKLKVDFNVNTCLGTYQGYFVLNQSADVLDPFIFPQSYTGSSRYNQYTDASGLKSGLPWYTAYGQQTNTLEIKLNNVIRLDTLSVVYENNRYYHGKITKMEGYLGNNLVAVSTGAVSSNCQYNCAYSDTVTMPERVNRIKIFFELKNNTVDKYMRVAHVSIIAKTDFANWQNQENKFDVNSDGYLSPIDALLIINQLNREQYRTLGTTHPYDMPLWDVTGDNAVSNLDALTIINELNKR